MSLQRRQEIPLRQYDDHINVPQQYYSKTHKTVCLGDKNRRIILKLFLINVTSFITTFFLQSLASFIFYVDFVLHTCWNKSIHWASPSWPVPWRVKNSWENVKHWQQWSTRLLQWRHTQLQLQREEGAFKVSLRGIGLITSDANIFQKNVTPALERPHFWSASPNFRSN